MAQKINALPSQSKLRALLDYDPNTGAFIWRISPSGRVRAGDVAGRQRHAKGYVTICIDKVDYAAHRLAWVYMTGREPAHFIDHINRNKRDNRFCNLREANASENLRNAKIKSNNTSGAKGVFWSERAQKWLAIITVDYQRTFLGYHDTKEQAISARRDAERQLFGEYTTL